MHTPTRFVAHTCVLLGVVAVTSTVSSAAILYDLHSTKLDGTAGENTYIGASPNALAYTGGQTPALQWTLESSNNYSYMVGNYSATALTEVGDSITLDYSYTLSSSTAIRSNTGAFRVGLFNSGGTPLTEDFSANGLNVLTNDTGYFAMYSKSTAADDTFSRRNGGVSNILWDSGSRTAVSGSPTLNGIGSGTTISGQFKITLTGANELTLSSIVNGGLAQTVTVGSNLITTFDSFSFFVISGQGDATVTFNELSVTYSAIPEPTTLALLAGIAGLGVAAFRRRR